MTRLNRFDRFEGWVATVLAHLFMFGGPVGLIAAAFYFIPPHLRWWIENLPWWIQIPLLACALIGGIVLAIFVMAFVEPPFGWFFGYIRRRTGRKPLEEIERTIREEQEEAECKREERAKAAFMRLGQSEQLYSLFLLHKEGLNYIKLISSLLQYVLIALVCIGVFLVAVRFFRW